MLTSAPSRRPPALLLHLIAAAAQRDVAQPPPAAPPAATATPPTAAQILGRAKTAHWKTIGGTLSGQELLYGQELNSSGTPCQINGTITYVSATQYRLPAFMKEWATTPRGALLADQSFWRPDAILAEQGLMRFQVFARLCGLDQKAADASKTRHYEWTKFGKLPGEDLDLERLEAERLGEMAVPINPRWVQLRYMSAPQRAAWLRFWQGKKQATHWPDEAEVAELLAELARFAQLAREHVPEE